ncbi:hypothetical protein M758_6G092900 [Ceratodon purpureus]|nr:hypothetical protein M758_6G092900 [Ceratodon purpureus]
MEGLVGCGVRLSATFIAILYIESGRTSSLTSCGFCVFVAVQNVVQNCKASTGVLLEVSSVRLERYLLRSWRALGESAIFYWRLLFYGCFAVNYRDLSKIIEEHQG